MRALEGHGGGEFHVRVRLVNAGAQLAGQRGGNGKAQLPLADIAAEFDDEFEDDGGFAGIGEQHG